MPEPKTDSIRFDIRAKSSHLNISLSTQDLNPIYIRYFTSFAVTLAEMDVRIETTEIEKVVADVKLNQSMDYRILYAQVWLADPVEKGVGKITIHQGPKSTIRDIKPVVFRYGSHTSHPDIITTAHPSGMTGDVPFDVDWP